MRNVAHWEVMPVRAGEYAPFPDEVDGGLRRILRSRGIDRLYSHQADAYRRVRAGENVVLVTPTASGKTLGYNLPILTRFSYDATATALHIFPTKSLSQDQKAGLDEIVLDSGVSAPTYTYDGDTPSSIRNLVRDRSRIVITNPDMLHNGVLPNHPKWTRFLSGLRYVVIDELHTYRGVFGSHLANVIRRLKRIAAFYGARPRFICCSATIGNPLEMARRIIEEDVVLIDRNGAPQGERHFLLYNPPQIDVLQGTRRSVVNEAHEIAARLLANSVRTVVFTRSRTLTEVISAYIKRSIDSQYGPHRADEIVSYRGGYLPRERRAIERGLRDGSLTGVVSTNALELGVDIGGLDASVIAGFPGTIASCWQQAGRAGRTTKVSLSILIASAAPIDQFVIRHPEYLFGTSPESGHVDPDNINILLDQLKCAVYELPYRDDDASIPQVGELLSYLQEQGIVHHSGKFWHWTDQSYPAKQVSLRTSALKNVVIIDVTGGGRRVIGEMDIASAKMLLHDGAIYLHGGDQFIVEHLDIDREDCAVIRSNAGYFTESVVKTDVKLMNKIEEVIPRLGIVLADIMVRTRPTSFKKIIYKTHEIVGREDINLSADEVHTRAVAVLFGEDTAAGLLFASLVDRQRSIVMSCLGYMIRNVAAVFLLCDVRDLGVVERVRDPDLGVPALYLYDRCPGGSGLAEGFCADAESILCGCRDIVGDCTCERGCPSCIGPFENRSPYSSKELMVYFLDSWLAKELMDRSVSPHVQAKIEGGGASNAEAVVIPTAP